MKVTLQLPEPVGQEILNLPDFETFVRGALMKALHERRRQAVARQTSMEPGRRLTASEEQALHLPPKKNRDRELAWRRAHQKELQKHFAGQWVVIEGESVVASNQDAAHAVEEARSKGILVPFLFHVEESRTTVQRHRR